MPEALFSLQLFCVIVFHRRIFSYTPIHYAFVIKGYKEKTIVLGFYLLQAVFSILGLLIGLATL